MMAAVWKKKELAIKKSYQRNVLTLSQTMGLVVFLYINGVVSDYVLLPSENNSLFILEMLRIIFVENIAFKFLFPIYLIYKTQSTLPSLWQRRDTDHNKKHFVMTKLNFAPAYPAKNPTTISKPSKQPRFGGTSLKTIPEVDIV